MASFGTDFHATLDEIVSLVEGWADRYPIVLSAFAFPPNRQVPICRKTIRDVLDHPDVSSLVFSEGPADPSWSQAHDAVVSGLVVLRLNIGRIEARGLEQSMLSTMDATPTWKKMNREIKKMTTAGANLIWDDGRTAFDRNARFTTGAKALAASGVPLRQFANSTFVYQPK